MAYEENVPPHYKGEAGKNVFRMIGYEITGASILAKVYRPDMTTFTKICTIVEPLSGQVFWTTDDEGTDFSAAGEYIEQHIVTFATGARRTSEMMTFYVNELMEIPEL